MNLLMDIPSDSELDAIQRVSNSEEMRFHQVVGLVGLDPSCDFRFANLRRVDFRGADLRGFDFTGADLRFSVRDSATVVDNSTIFVDAQEMWVDVELRTPTVDLMLAVERATSSIERKRAIESLFGDAPEPRAHQQVGARTDLSRG